MSADRLQKAVHRVLDLSVKGTDLVCQACQRSAARVECMLVNLLLNSLVHEASQY